MPGQRRLTPLRGIGIRYISKKLRRPRSLNEAHEQTPGRPTIIWASCVFKPITTESMQDAQMGEGGANWQIKQIFTTSFVKFNDPCN